MQTQLDIPLVQKLPETLENLVRLCHPEQTRVQTRIKLKP